MHRGKGSFKSRSIQEYKNNLKRIKQRKVSSIWDIIDDPDLRFFQKVDYIRHHYVYYDGNYELFHDENGKPNKTKNMLDKVIKGIVNRQIDPSELNILNKEILRKHKIQAKQEKTTEELYLSEYSQEQSKPVEIVPSISSKKEDTCTIGSMIYKQGMGETTNPYFELINRYLHSLSPEERVKASAWSYRDLKKVAKWWDKNNKPIPPTTPSEIQQKKSLNVLLKGYERYWKNNKS